MFFVPALSGLAVWLVAAPAQAQLVYETIDFGPSSTFLTGIRADTIVGNYVIPGSSNTGGLLYNLTTGAWTAFPQTTVNGVSFPGAVSSSPYGPNFGSQGGILNAVGSYKTSASPYDLSYIYNGSAAPSAQLTTLVYPGTPRDPTLDTIAHSTFGDQVVGNYDTGLATGNAFVYSISKGTYTTNNYPGAISTTAYGVYGDKIAGGYDPPGLGLERGYIYDEVSNTWATYNHPGAVFTHFEGITGAGRAGTYNLVADWASPDGTLHASVLHIGDGGSQTWIDYGVPGATLTSANSIYRNEAIGIYVGADGSTNGYLVSIPGIYNPVSNTGLLISGAADTPALSGVAGDDLVNTGTIRTSGLNTDGISSDSFGVVTNSGTISVNGVGGAGVELSGTYGTLLNAGDIAAAPGADAIRTGPTAFGTDIVNTGTIDGPVLITAGPLARLENSGWLGNTAAGAGTINVINGNFVQTAAGTLAVRLGAGGGDTFAIGGIANLAGTLAPEVTTIGYAPALGEQFQVVEAGAGVYGTFTTLTQPAGLAAGTRLDTLYGPTTVDLAVTPSSYATLAADTYYAPTATAIDSARPAAGETMSAMQSQFYEPLYSLDAAQIQTALQQLTPVVYSDTLMINRGTFQMVDATIASELQSRRGAPEPSGSSAAKGPDGLTTWIAGSGQFVTQNDGSNGAPGYSGSSGGVLAGIDVTPTPGALAGVAVAFNSQSMSTPDAADYTGQSVQLQVYGSVTRGILFVDAQAGGVFNEGTARRTLSLEDVGLTGDANGDGFGGSIRGGARFDVSGWNIEPSLTLGGLSISQYGLTENGSNPLRVAVGGTSIDSVQTLLGVQVDHRFPINRIYAIVPSVNAGWSYEMLDTSTPVSANFVAAPDAAFGVTGASIGRSAAVAGVHATLETSSALQVFAGYDAILDSQFAAQTITGGIRYIW